MLLIPKWEVYASAMLVFGSASCFGTSDENVVGLAVLFYNGPFKERSDTSKEISHSSKSSMFRRTRHAGCEALHPGTVVPPHHDTFAGPRITASVGGGLHPAVSKNDTTSADLLGRVRVVMLSYR